MIQKEKAEQLVRKYYSFGINKEGQTLSWDESKQCASIAVDEIIEAIKIADNITFMYIIEYYKGIKQEIKKL